MKKKTSQNLENLFAILLGTIAIFTLKSVFENDESKIISQKGSKYLSDNNKMDEINKMINESEHNEVVI